MKIQYLELFKNVAKNGCWKEEQEIEVLGEFYESHRICGEEVEIVKVYGQATKTVSFGEYIVQYVEGFEHEAGDRESFKTSIEGIDYPVELIGCEIIDDEGETVDESEIWDLLYQYHGIDYSDYLEGVEQVQRVGEEGEEFYLEVTNQPNIIVKGKLQAYASSTDNQAMTSYYSGSTGEWQTFALYETTAGQFVCHKSKCSKWVGVRDYFEALVTEDPSDIMEFFGNDWLAQDLYAELELAETVTAA
jgi:hypothetical protein